MQDRWENREYVVKKWPYPNIPVYVVCPRDGEGCCWTLHRNYLLPINSNMGQDEADGSEERVKNNTSLTPVPSADSSLQDSPDQPAPVRCSTWTTRNQLPWWYWNFGLSAGTWATSIWDAWVDLCVCLIILACLYTAFWRGACRTYFADCKICLLSTTHFSVQGNSLDVSPQVDSWVGKGVDQRTFGPIATPLPV